MKNKLLISKFKDNAELSCASYGYFHLVTGKNNPTFINVKDNKEQEVKREILLTDILDSTYNGYEVYTPSRLPTLKPDKVGTLTGNFSPTQAKNFLKKYDVLIHQPNTHSGFSATLFGEKRKQTNTQTKEVTYTNEGGYINYILAIRGTETDNIKDYFADKNLLFKDTPKEQYFDMLLFYQDCIKQGYITKSTPLIVVGHSLGGCLAQLFALSFATAENASIINEVYTYNTSLESRSVA